MTGRSLLPRRSRHGAALLLTLWCVAIVAVTVVLTARIVDSDVESESARSRRFEARELALTGIAHGGNPKLERDCELFHQRLEDGSQLDVRVTSESARLNINLLLQQPDRLILKGLFKLWEVPPDEARVAIDSLIDWTDRDDLRQLNGAERQDLEGQTDYSLPQNRDFQSISEMRRVRGMDAIARYQPEWPIFFSVFSGERVDIQDVSSDVLCVTAGLSHSQAAQLVKLRNGSDGLPGTDDDLVIQTIDEVIPLLGLNDVQAEALRAGFVVGGEPTRIESTAIVGGTQHRISTVVNRKSAPPARMTWDEQ